MLHFGKNTSDKRWGHGTLPRYAGTVIIRKRAIHLFWIGPLFVYYIHKED